MTDNDTLVYHFDNKARVKLSLLSLYMTYDIFKKQNRKLLTARKNILITLHSS